MFKKILLIFAMFAGSGFLTANAAPVLSFSPSSQSVSAGQEALVDIILNGVSGEILSGYDLTITYDGAIVEDNGSFFFGINNSPNYDDTIANQISWQDIGGGPLTHDLGQGPFRLAEIHLLGLTAGISALDVSVVNLTGDNLTGVNPTIEAGSITVPEPATMLLIGLGALTMVNGKRRHTLTKTLHA